MGQGDVERFVGLRQGISAVDQHSEIQVDPDGDPYPFQLFSGKEIFELKQNFACRLGKPAWKVDRINRRPNGEINMNSFRELAEDSILEFTQLQTNTSGRQDIDVHGVSNAEAQHIKYQVDFSFTNNGSTGYFVLRILQISEKRYRSVIQTKDSASTVPHGVSTTDPTTIYVRDVGVNETLYREKQLKIWHSSTR